MKYCLDLYQRKRIPTIEVKIGDVPLGGKNPIRIQSMTTTDTMDTLKTVEQTIRMVESGAEYVRITAPSLKEARNLEQIKKELRSRGCNVPLVADIHFTPNAAEMAARIVEKVRVNPGNYADKKKFTEIEYTDQSYQDELDRIHKRFAPLVAICKEYGTAMRIGTNHGSLSDRILSRYGDTPLGMVESAFEFIRICEMYNYDQLVVSMKASNPQVMVQAYRMLVAKMLENGKCYPLHLGVTEAGEGEDGRVKSAQGIAALLMDGIGDTVRVSLTEEPEYESPVAKFLVDIFDGSGYEADGDWRENILVPDPPTMVNPFSFERIKSQETINLGNGNVPRVVADFSRSAVSRQQVADIGYSYSHTLDKYNFADMAADYIYLGKQLPDFELPGGLKKIVDYSFWRNLRDLINYYPLFSDVAETKGATLNSELNFLRLGIKDIDDKELAPLVNGPEKWTLILCASGRQAAHQWRWMVNRLADLGNDKPVILSSMIPETYIFYEDSYIPDSLRIDKLDMQQLFMSAMTGTMVVDGQIDGIMLQPASNMSNRLSFGVLQASRLRMTKTEYISCPSCGRTLFDLQETTARIRSRTEHLKGVKIGIMGCIVNGPGEMADADYGYVGVGPDKIALYRGKEVIERGVKTAEAVDKLIDLIAADGNWIENPE